ncbi:MAG: glycoside hydrolase family protein [Bacteroidales bacterium]|nr:glycoside hydrolase family protein [Bacteroidales bacterium]
MKKICILILLMVSVSATLTAALVPGNEYFIVNSVYEKVLGSSQDGTTPALSAFSADHAEDYIFVAEEAPTSGYVLLRQKSTGRYLASSTSDSYSVVFQSAKSTADAYCWRANEGLDQELVNKRKTSRRMGIDGGHSGDDYVSVYYDKNKGSHALFHLVPTTDGDLSTSLSAYVSSDYTSAIGTKAVDYYQLNNATIEREDTVDIHIKALNNAIVGTSSRVNLKSLGTWLIFDNIMPSDVISKYLRYVRIKGATATNGTNCRVAIYLNGAAVIPLRAGSTLQPMTIYSEPNLEGTRYNVADGNHTTMSTRNNTTRSFILRRGYMATVASDREGKGYSRVYVADHADLVVNTLPTALDRRISSIHIRPWQYVSKKGWCSTTGQSANQTECKKVRATWFYTWSADRKSTENLEYIPIRQHIWWPSMSTINGYESTAALSMNEPEHSEQHDNCDCGGAISAWTACTKTPDFLPSGARIGSPSPTDASWLTEYIGHVDDMAYRCDFVAFHSYWGPNEANGASAWYSRLKSIYDNTKRPIWITEWNYGASWTADISSNQYEEVRRNIQSIVEMLDTCSFVERYSIYNWDTWYRAMISWDDGWVTPAGQVYRDTRSTFAYNAKMQKVPNWWAPSAKDPSFDMILSDDKSKVSFTITNPNADLTESLVVQRLNDCGEWENVAEITDRWRFDSQTLNISNISTNGMNASGDSFRVVVTTTTGSTRYSSTSFGLLVNPTIEATSKNSVEGWTLSREAQNGYTKSTGDTYFEVWDPTAAKMNFDYYQELTELEPGIYSLAAQVFNTTNSVEGATVNGAVGLYALTSNHLYFAPVTTDLDLANDAASLPEGTTLSLDRIIVTDGQLRVGIRNLGTMAARWAGGDNFLLHRVDDLSDVELENEYAKADVALYNLMPEVEGGLDATRFIVNPDCNRQTSYGWTTSNVETKADAESFNSDSNNAYWNKWKSGAYTSTLSQEIAGLPEGTYTFSALLRGQNTATLTLTATAGDDAVSQSFVGTGATTASGSDYPNGWQKVTTPAIKLAHGDTLTISMQMSSSATAWWSADRFTLTLTEIPESLTALRDIEDNRAVGKPVHTTSVFDLSGRCLSPDATLTRGLYIINGKKVLVK